MFQAIKDRVLAILPTSFNTSTLTGLAEKPLARVLLRCIHLGFVGLVLWLLVGKISTIGWDDVLDALPTTPLYYLLFLIWYFAIPVTELIVYRLMWGFSVAKYFAVFARKRVYNLALVSYSGEAWLAYWARDRFEMPNARIYATIKDSNILSALSSNSFTIIALIVFFATGQISLIIDADPNYQMYLGLAVVVGLILVPLILRFRRHIISLKPDTAVKIVMIHFVRFSTMLACQVGMWSVILPQVSLSTWLLFVTAQLVLQRVPFLPNTDLLFLGLGLSMAPLLDAPQATIAGMFLGAGALAQVLNLAIYVITSFGISKPKKPDAVTVDLSASTQDDDQKAANGSPA